MPDPNAGVAVDSLAEENALYSRVTWRLLPVLVISYMVGYIDRVNVGFAKLQMLQDLHFSEATYGLGAGIFFITYLGFELPSNLALSRFGARRWLAPITIAWGFISASTMFIHTPGSFYLMRCLLGAAEAGMFPGVILYLTYWYPSHRRSGIMALFMTAQPASGLVGGPLSGWILQSFSGARHLAGWQWLFLVEGLPAVLMGVVLFFWLDDGIRDAAWLTEPQKRLLERQIEAESKRKHKHSSIAALLRDGRVWLLGLITFSSVLGLYGVTFWLPTIIQASGVQQPLHVGLLTMIPYGCAVIAMILTTRSSDRSGERRWHLAISTFIGGLGLVFSVLFAHHSGLAMAALTLAIAGIFTSQPLFWSLPTAFLGGAAAAAAIAIINSMGNFAGFVSPYLMGLIKDLTHSTTFGLYALAFSLFVSSLLTLRVPAALVNERLDARPEAVGEIPDTTAKQFRRRP
jgi:D-galactonate transporter